MDHFKWKKWILFVITMVVLIVTIIQVILDNNSLSIEPIFRKKTEIIISSILLCLIKLLGVVGTYKEHFLTMVVYSMLCAIISGYNLYASFEIGLGQYWAQFVIYLVISALGHHWSMDILCSRHAKLIEAPPCTPLYASRPEDQIRIAQNPSE